MITGFEPVIGLEVHVQLGTRTKLFCASPTEFGVEPNTSVCPVCLGLPGALPVINEAAVVLGVTAALGLDCTINQISVFARKNYFYPDLPKGYQITQFDQPLASGGQLDAPLADGASRRVRIRRIHLEEDAGKSLHDRLPARSAIDLNRAGVPLIEIVTEPDIASAFQARAFLNRLKQLLQYLGVSDCDMEKGSLRVDANVSVRPAGSAGLGVKTEVKNMNSFANVERAIEFEVERQIRLVRAGDPIRQETLLWDANRGEARPMRSKEESHDYRYFPEPDLPPLVLEASRIAEIRLSLRELPATRAARFRAQLGLSVYDSEVLTADRAVANYFEQVVQAGADAKSAGNWVVNDVLGYLNERGIGILAAPVSAARLAELIGLVSSGDISTTTARRVFASMVDSGDSAADIVERGGLVQVRDSSQLEGWVREVIDEHAGEVERLRAGEEKLFAFLMGQVMKRSRGKADPKLASVLLRERVGQ